MNEEREFSYNNKEPDFVWASVLLPVSIVKDLWTTIATKTKPTKDFCVPGILSGYVSKEKAIAS